MHFFCGDVLVVLSLVSFGESSDLADKVETALNGCGSKFSIPYWILYIVLMTLILLSVFISAITSQQLQPADGRKHWTQ